MNVAIGCAGLPSLVDLRGTPDDRGRLLEATVVALADEVSAASGLVMGKAARVPAAVVRGVVADAPETPARALVREPQEDLFRESPLVAIGARRTIAPSVRGTSPRCRRGGDPGGVHRARAAPHRPWMFTALESQAARRGLLATIADAWRADLRGDGTPEATVERRLARSAVRGAAPMLDRAVGPVRRRPSLPRRRAGAER